MENTEEQKNNQQTIIQVKANSAVYITVDDHTYKKSPMTLSDTTQQTIDQDANKKLGLKFEDLTKEHITNVLQENFEVESLSNSYQTRRELQESQSQSSSKRSSSNQDLSQVEQINKIKKTGEKSLKSVVQPLETRSLPEKQEQNKNSKKQRQNQRKESLIRKIKIVQNDIILILRQKQSQNIEISLEQLFNNLISIKSVQQLFQQRNQLIKFVHQWEQENQNEFQQKTTQKFKWQNMFLDEGDLNLGGDYYYAMTQQLKDSQKKISGEKKGNMILVKNPIIFPRSEEVLNLKNTLVIGEVKVSMNFELQHNQNNPDVCLSKILSRFHTMYHDDSDKRKEQQQKLKGINQIICLIAYDGARDELAKAKFKYYTERLIEKNPQSHINQQNEKMKNVIEEFQTQYPQIQVKILVIHYNFDKLKYLYGNVNNVQDKHKYIQKSERLKKVEEENTKQDQEIERLKKVDEQNQKLKELLKQNNIKYEQF